MKNCLELGMQQIYPHPLRLFISLKNKMTGKCEHIVREKTILNSFRSSEYLLNNEYPILIA